MCNPAHHHSATIGSKCEQGKHKNACEDSGHGKQFVWIDRRRFNRIDLLVTFMDASSAPIPAPTRPHTTSPVMMGPISWIVE